MLPKRPREMALAAAAVLLVAIAVWGMQQGGTAQPSPPGTRAATATAAHPQAPAKNPLTEVDLKGLRAVRPEPDEGTRNPFRFRPKPAPAPSAAIVKQQQQAAAAAEQAAQGPVEPPPLPRIPLKYIGDMADPKSPGKRIAILSDARGTYYGREGDVVEGRYRIVRMGVESIELAYLDGRGRQTIRQTGQ